MPVIRITCPKCATTATGTAARPLPAGKPIKCPRCGTVFRIPAQTKPAPPIQKPAPSAGEAKATTLRVPARPVGPVSKRVIYRITCPSCKVVLKSAVAPPPGKAVRCPKCRTPFVTRPRQTKLAPRRAETKLSPGPAPKPPKQTRLSSGPPRPKETKLGGPPDGRPVTIYKCPACAAVMRITGKLPAGKMFPCPRCRRPIPIIPKPRPGKPPAKKTTLGQKAKPTKLAPARSKTTLAPKSSGPSPLLPRGALIRCVHCATLFKSPQTMPVGRLLKCSKCARTFRAVAVPKPPARPKPAAAAPKPARIRRPAPAPQRANRGLYLLMAIALTAIAVVVLGYFDVVPLFPRRAIPESAWRQFVPPEGGCRIDMPGTPELKHARAAGPGGSDAQKYVVIRQRQDAAFYLAISDRRVRAAEPASFDAIYAAERDAIVSVANQGRLARQDEVSTDGHRGKEFQIEFPDGATLVGRVYQVRGGPTDRVYVLVATGANVEAGTGMAARFFDSFHIDASEKR